ncbi:hypothetical protein O3Q51_10045 [Cryomorphaceae bacterium 1068]|nr:hypothetical protein [Cryomorphaceae bacterium 1068]
MKNKKLKRALTIISIIAIVIIAAYWTLEYALGNINYEATFATEYIGSGKPEKQKIKTDWAILETPDNWIHVVLKPTDPGYVGCFLTGQGAVFYEYGWYAPSYEKGDNDIYQSVKDTIRGLAIITITSADKTGFHVPKQNSMYAGLTFYPSETCRELKHEILDILTTLDLKKIMTPANNT